jgi:hypothetical protein
MNHSEFKIGAEFICNFESWRCTDVGTRVVVAIKLNHPKDVSWYNGPPYAIHEYVFDEDDIKGCSRDSNAIRE